MTCLFVYLPLICGDLIDEDSDHWELLLCLLDIYKVLVAPSISLAATYALTAMIQDHHSLYKELFPEIPLTPKQHHMIHYPNTIRRFGPLGLYSCMRFEGKHKPLKHIARTCNNYVNVEKTVAKKHQLGQSYEFLLKEDIDHRSIDISGQCVVPASVISNAEIVCNSLGCDLNTNVNLCNAVTVNGYQFRPKSAVLLSWDDMPQFGEVQQIVLLNSKVHLIVQPWTTLHLDRHYHAYAIKMTAPNDVQVLVKLPDDLGDYRPVHVVQSHSQGDRTFYIPTRFQLI